MLRMVHRGRPLRWLMPFHSGAVSREQAVEIARKECIERGLPWREPIKVYRHYGGWAVWTFANHRGGNVRVVIDRDKRAVQAVYGPTPR